MMIVQPEYVRAESVAQEFNMSIEKEKRIHRKSVFNGHLVQVYLDEVQLAGKLAQREVVLHQDACAIIPVTADRQVLFVEQYRYAIEQVLLELPAGKVDFGEEADACARRELEEETGYIGDLIPIGAVYTSPGFCNELIHLYIAKNLVKTKQYLDEGEFLNVVSIPLEEIWKLIKQGQVTDAKTLAAFTLAKEHL